MTTATTTAELTPDQINSAKELSSIVRECEVRGSQARIQQFQALADLREAELFRALGYKSWNEYITVDCPSMSETTIKEGVKIVRAFEAYDTEVIAAIGVEKLKAGLRLKNDDVLKTLDEVIETCQGKSLSELREIIKSGQTTADKGDLLTTTRFPSNFKSRFESMMEKYRLALLSGEGGEPSETMIMDFILVTNNTLPQGWLNEQAAGRGGAVPGAENEEGTKLSELPPTEVFHYLADEFMKAGKPIEEIITGMQTALESQIQLQKDKEATAARQKKLDDEKAKEKAKTDKVWTNKLLKAKQGTRVNMANGDVLQLTDTFKDANGGDAHTAAVKFMEGANTLSIPEEGKILKLQVLLDEGIVELVDPPKQEKLIEDKETKAKGKKATANDATPATGISKSAQANKGKGGGAKKTTANSKAKREESEDADSLPEL
jgi:hypothetical protein